MESFSVLVVLLVMAVTTAGAVFTSLYLYRWRRILSLDGKLVTVPEELISYLGNIANGLSRLEKVTFSASSEQKNRHDALTKLFSKSDEGISQLLETVMVLQNSLDKKDAEIYRLRQGYDAEIFRRFVSRFLRVRQALGDVKKSASKNIQDLDQISRLFDDALDECGVEAFAPRIGEDFREAVGVADNPKVIETADISASFKIVDVLEFGYRFRNGPDKGILLPASVSIYLAQKSGA